MKTKEIRELSADDLNQKIKDLKSEVFNLKFQKTIKKGQMENPVKIRLVKRDIARALTIQREKQK